MAEQGHDSSQEQEEYYLEDQYSQNSQDDDTNDNQIDRSNQAISKPIKNTKKTPVGRGKNISNKSSPSQVKKRLDSDSKNRKDDS